MLNKECKDKDKDLASNTANPNMKPHTIMEWILPELALKEITSTWHQPMVNTDNWKELGAVVHNLLVVKEQDQWQLRFGRMVFETDLHAINYI